MSDSEKLACLHQQDWKTIIPVLTLYAVYRVHRLSWRTGRKDLPGGRQPKDFALDAIKMVWTGERTWDPTKQPDLLKILKGIVDSLVSHLVESMEHTRRKIPKEEVGKDVFDPPDERSASALDEVIAADAFRKLLDQVKGDQDLELVLYCVEDGLSKATDIADALTMPIERVYKAKRKLGLILKNMRENNDG